MLVAADFHQHDGGYLQLFQLRRLDAVAARAHAHGFDVALHVEHGEALGADDLRVGVGEHALDHRLLVERGAVGLLQDGREGRGAAAEIGLLLDQVGEAPLADALHLLVDQAAAGQGGKAEGRRLGGEVDEQQQGKDERAHGRFLCRMEKGSGWRRNPWARIRSQGSRHRPGSCCNRRRWTGSCSAGCRHRRRCSPRRCPRRSATSCSGWRCW
ncbi:Uncharacterised protein [Pseudomonas aeruginosa]|nr:Uncharacterised protein [Pseudomonas aeruginosa]